MKKLLAVVVSAIGLGLVFLLVCERHARVSLRDELRSLRLQMQELAEQETVLRQEQQRAVSSTSLPVDTPHETAETTRLRDEIRQLRARLTEVEGATAGISNQIAADQGANIPLVYPDATKRKEYALAGYATPQSALQSVLWAIREMDAKTFQASLTDTVAETFAQQFHELPEGVMPGGFRNGAMFKASGFRVLEESPVSDDEMRVKVFLEGTSVVIQPVFKRVGGDWKWARNEHSPK